jgi:HAD superfamily 5'-nucleotidase-like hydrolase
MRQTVLNNNSKLIARVSSSRPLAPWNHYQKFQKAKIVPRATENGSSNPEEQQKKGLTTDDDTDVGFKNSLSPSLDLESFTTVAGTVDIVEPEEAEVDVFGELSTGNYHFAEDLQEEDEFLLQGGNLTTLGLSHPREVMELPTTEIARRLDNLLEHVGVTPSPYPRGEPQRAVYCSRTLNMRAIQAIGYDMDYTLVHYDVDAWEGRAYSYGMQSLSEMGVPVDGLQFDSSLIIRGLILDCELGNIVKADRFGIVKRAMHGTRMLSPAEVRASYGRETVSLRNESRWVFLNTLFSVSEAVMFAQLVERLDAGIIPHQVCAPSYSALYKLVSKALFLAHVEGKLKAEIVQDPAKFIERDPELAQTLLDQRASGKSLLLITNSDLEYTDAVMAFAHEPYLPQGMKWRDMFDYIIVNARKPDFFKGTGALYEVVTPDGLMRPAHSLRRGGIYCGGSAKMVEQALELSGENFLYIGDHIYSDAARRFLNLSWRTCLVIRELEEEIEAFASGREHRAALREALKKKDLVGDAFNNLRLARQRALMGPDARTAHADGPVIPAEDESLVNEALAQLIAVMERLDDQIAPAIEQDGADFNARWGYLSRAGVNDRSQLLSQIERYADIYTSRVSNFLRYSPFVYFRSPTQSMAHDRPTADTRVTNVKALRAALRNGGRGGSGTSSSDEDHHHHHHHNDSVVVSMNNAKAYNNNNGNGKK